MSIFCEFKYLCEFRNLVLVVQVCGLQFERFGTKGISNALEAANDEDTTRIRLHLWYFIKLPRSPSSKADLKPSGPHLRDDRPHGHVRVDGQQAAPDFDDSVRQMVN